MASYDPDSTCLGDVLSADPLSDQLGAIEAGALLGTLMDYDAGTGWHPSLHPPSFGSH